MVAPTMVISIDRTGMAGAPSPLVIKADGTTPFKLVGWREPAMRPQVRTPGPSYYVDGDGPTIAWTWQETVLLWEVAARGAASETVSRALTAELLAAVARASYPITVTVNGAPDETWQCKPGALEPGDARNYVDLNNHDPVWVVSMKAHPIRITA